MEQVQQWTDAMSQGLEHVSGFLGKSGNIWDRLCVDSQNEMSQRDMKNLEGTVCFGGKDNAMAIIDVILLIKGWSQIGYCCGLQRHQPDGAPPKAGGKAGKGHWCGRSRICPGIMSRLSTMPQAWVWPRQKQKHQVWQATTTFYLSIYLIQQCCLMTYNHQCLQLLATNKTLSLLPAPFTFLIDANKNKSNTIWLIYSILSKLTTPTNLLSPRWS